MSTFKKIIIFNGGSGGDFLKLLCLQQKLDAEYNLSDKGRVIFNSQYFKDISRDYYFKTFSTNQLDLSKVYPVDNSHFYFDWYDKYFKMYYIDYPDNIQDVIFDLYITKVYNNDVNLLYNWHIDSIPESLRKFITPDNIQKAIKINWQRNIESWRVNNKLIKIDLITLFDIVRLTPVIENICDSPIIDYDLFFNTWTAWVDKNKSLKQSLLK
jgi:hypothetical protein